LANAYEHRHLQIVSWSMHERDVVRATCSGALVDRFCALHRNALDTAKPWKRHLYPNVRFVLKRFGGKHPLKEYFRMIGYVLPDRLRPPTPARWLRHALQQMETNGGRYRRITSEATRDWHKLLEYHEHDCRGMRKVIRQAAHELNLWKAYEQAHFVVFEDGREITVDAGRCNPRLDALLERLGASRWAFLTACNPESKRLSVPESKLRHQQLIQQLITAGYSPLESERCDAGTQWPPDAGALVPGIGRREARDIGRQHGQLAIHVGHCGFQARLIACGLRPDRAKS
jgi:Protein of unknown function (DUF3293)